MTDPPMRRRIRQAVEDYPGLHLRELARHLGTSVALVEYHVPFLVTQGLVERVEEGNLHRLYPAALPQRDRARLAALRDRAGLQVVMVLLDRGPLRHGALAKATRLGKSTLSFRLRRLEEAGLVAQADGAYAAVAPAELRRLLARHRPTPDLMDRFAGLWSDLYG